MDGIVAIVGRPNVGKSTVFNRLLGERTAIVDNTPGVTRDRIYGTCNWLTKSLRIIDTGGVQLANQPFQKEIRMQVEIAIDEADLILFVVNGQQGLSDDDSYIAQLLQKSNKQIILAVNKIDDVSTINNIYEFYALGVGDPMAISSAHGIGFGDLLDKIIEMLPLKAKTEYPGMIKFAVIGRPNVGKSSLVNAILKQDRVIVSPIEGTTRDAIDTVFKVKEESFVAIDTAGIRKRGKIYENIEKYSIIRAMSAIERADVVLIILDGEQGIIEQDKHVAGYAVNAGKGVIIVYNKWDTVEKDEHTMNEISKQIRQEFIYLAYAPIVFVSALKQSRTHLLVPMIQQVYNSCKLRIATNVLNEVILDAQVITPPPTHNGKRLKIYYASQVSTQPTLIILFVNNSELLHFSYKRYLENRLRDAFDFIGIPINIVARNKEQV